jgi:hypothetical protein
MAATISITESQALTVLRAFVLSLVDLDGDHVVRSLGNRVAMPTGEFIVLAPLGSTALSTTVQSYIDAPGAGVSQNKRSTQFAVQVDCYGAQALDRASVLSMLLRAPYACEFFAAAGFDMQPLYAGEAKQLPFVTGEAQYMERWSFDAALQMNPVVAVPQRFADQLHVDLIDVDAKFPP